MRTLRKAWDGAEQWMERYNALLAVGTANADAEVMRGELDALFQDIAAHVDARRRARANVLNLRRSYAPPPHDVTEDMFLLFRWIGEH